MEKYTKIVATVSDRNCEPQFLQKLFDNGMNVVRMNSAHLGREGIERIVANVRAVSPRIALLLDTKGPEIRTTPNAGGGVIEFRTGQKVTVKGMPDAECDDTHIYMNYRDLAHDLRPGLHLLIDDGELDFMVTRIEGDEIRAVAQNDGRLGSRKSVNIPGADIRLPAVSDRDRANIALAAELGIDFIAHSFVRSRRDVAQIRALLDSLQSPIKVIAKIENQQGVDNFDEILEASYGIMIARGDLGIEVAAERIPRIQRRMISACIAAHKPVIVATQMLHSMISNPRPTRAEVSDVANAVYQRADALMLSGETASGRYPVEAVATMSRIAAEAERAIAEEQPAVVPKMADSDVTSFLARQAVLSETEVGTRVIVTDAYHGRTARFIASFRGNNPTIAVCYREPLCRWLALSYGVSAFHSKGKSASHSRPVEALRQLMAEGRLHADDRIAYVGSSDGLGASFLEINTVGALLQE